MVRSILALALGLSALAPVAAQAAAPSQSTSNRLPDRRYVETGSRSYVVGSEDGRFPAMGFHTRGEMGGVWTPPLKLVDGVWFGIDGTWLGSASKFTRPPESVPIRIRCCAPAWCSRWSPAFTFRAGTACGLRTSR